MKHMVKIIALVVALATQPAHALTIYVSSERDNTITVIDGDTLEVTDTVKVGNRPRGIELSPDYAHLYICASDDDTIEVLDTKTLKIIGQLPSGPDPELLTVSPDGKRIYVANEDDNLVTVVDVESKTKVREIPVGVEPEGMAVSHDGKIVVNTSETTNMAHFIDAASGESLGNVLVDQRPRFAEFTPNDDEVWVTAEIGGSLAVIDTKSRKVKKKITFPVPGLSKEEVQPVGVRIKSDRSAAFVALGPASRVAIVNPATYEVEEYLLVGRRVWQLGFSPDEKFLYTTNGLSNDISVIDVDARKVIKSVATGREPWGVAAKP